MEVVSVEVAAAAGEVLGGMEDGRRRLSHTVSSEASESLLSTTGGGAADSAVSEASWGQTVETEVSAVSEGPATEDARLVVVAVSSCGWHILRCLWTK